MTLPAIERARAFSQARLDDLRRSIASLVPPGATVVACGSYARREASAASDFDYFTIVPPEAADEAGPAPWEADLKRAITATVGVEPAKDGAFATVERADRMVRNIGGQHDDNAKLTRRMLFLLEGAPLCHEAAARRIRRALLDRYVQGGLEDGMALFLLSDMIRYYRTIAVDYEFKTTEGDRPKPWGLRHAKLLFSRRLLFASGLFSIAASRDADRGVCVTQLERLFDLPPIARLETICGAAAAAPLLRAYDGFLTRLAEPDLRRRLEALTAEERFAPDVGTIRADGQAFRAELGRLFATTFASDHPIHRAMLF